MSFLSFLSIIALPLIVILIILNGLLMGVDVYQSFLKGALGGLEVLIKIIPALVGLLTAVFVFRASGAMELLVGFVQPFCVYFGIPGDIVPLVLLRPVSGSASLALVSDIIKNNGADSFLGRLASVVMGSTETIFYTLALYFGSVGIKNSRYTLWAALLTDLVGFIAALFICRLLF